VASKSNRQRKLERARAERRLARRAEQARRKRQVQAAIGGALALILVALGTTWLLGGFDAEPEPVALPSCTWTAKDPSTPGLTDTGLPPSSGEARTGTDVLTIATDAGDLTASLDLSSVPCTASSLRYLGVKGYYDGVACSRLDTTAKLLTCGDPAGDGTGTPGYQFPLESQATVALGTAPPPSAAPDAASPSPSPVPSYYTKGMIVMANHQGANAGQFYIVYDDGSDLAAGYTIVGSITSGLDLVSAVAAEGVADGSAAGKPKKALTIKQLYVGAAPTAPPSTSSSASASESASPSPSASS
jgi:peptidyl-prolyl cis-trans isomerase B (cyclophilin B)